MSAALDPLDRDDFRVMWDALDEWGRARLLDVLDGGPVSVCTQVRSHTPPPPLERLPCAPQRGQYGPASHPADAGPAA